MTPLKTPAKPMTTLVARARQQRTVLGAREDVSLATNFVKDLTPFLVMKIIAVFYLFTFLGNYLFNQAKEQIKEMDMLANQIY